MLAHVQYCLDLFFFPIPVAPLPWAPMALCALVAVLSPSRESAQTRVGYLAFAFFALLVALFQIHLHVDGVEVFMVWSLFLVQFKILGAIALAMTFLVRSNRTLWLLAGATAALAVFQLLTFLELVGQAMNWIARLYVVGVFTASAYRHRDWLSG
jgi:hypothetical protein